jgi:D-alanyl-D-alanine carboxypeptidase/D-alanyl-D-alanine-endopeptidase (penicillin-binding protein 4)
MKLRLYLNFVIILLLCSSFSNVYASFQQELYEQKRAFYSYIISDVKTDHIYQEYASEVYSVPASCLKTLTALLALKHLGPDYQYETKLYKTTNQDIVISFSGDPTFTSENLINLLSPFKGNRVNKIILDASIFNTTPHSPNIVIDDIGTYYGQPVASGNVDKNLIHIKIVGTGINQSAQVTSDVEYKIDSQVQTTAEDSLVKFTWDGDLIKIKGNINVKDEPLTVKISPKDIDIYIMHKVQSVLKKLNIEGNIEIIHDKHKLPVNLTLVNQVKSEPLKDFIIPAMKMSDNLVFDALYLKIIHSEDPEIDDWGKGHKIIKKLLDQYFAIDLGENLVIDGSGMSRYNRMQPRKLMEILKHAYNIPEFIVSLPKPGEEDGHLKKRENLPSNVRAKPGGMSGIGCLCGYSMDASNPKVFVVMATSFSPPLKDMWEVIDKFLKEHLK